MSRVKGRDGNKKTKCLHGPFEPAGLLVMLPSDFFGRPLGRPVGVDAIFDGLVSSSLLKNGSCVGYIEVEVVVNLIRDEANDFDFDRRLSRSSECDSSEAVGMRADQK